MKKVRKAVSNKEESNDVMGILVVAATKAFMK